MNSHLFIRVTPIYFLTSPLLFVRFIPEPSVARRCSPLLPPFLFAILCLCCADDRHYTLCLPADPTRLNWAWAYYLERGAEYWIESRWLKLVAKNLVKRRGRDLDSIIIYLLGLAWLVAKLHTVVYLCSNTCVLSSLFSSFRSLTKDHNTGIS